MTRRDARKTIAGSFRCNFKFPANPRGNRLDTSCGGPWAKASRDSKSAWTERKITVSANIYPGTRGGNVRLDSDSELISFEIPSPILHVRHSLFPFLPFSLSLSSRIVVRHPRLSLLSLPLSLSLTLSFSLLAWSSSSPSLSVSFSRSLSLSSSLLSSFSNLVRVSDAYVQRERERERPGRNAFRSAPFSIGRICVSGFEIGEGRDGEGRGEKR